VLKFAFELLREENHPTSARRYSPDDLRPYPIAPAASE
jgi:hypothetical protein